MDLEGPTPPLLWGPFKPCWAFFLSDEGEDFSRITSWFKKTAFHKKLIVCAVFIILPFLFVGYVAYWYQHPQNNETTTVLIEKGTSLSQIAQILSKQKVLDSPELFKSVVYGAGVTQKLKAGEYLIPAHITPAQLIHILESGRVLLHPVTMIEGETCTLLVKKLLSNSHFPGVCDIPEEGSLLPETYHFAHGTDCQIVIKQMQRAMNETLAKVWAGRCQNHPLETPQELLILASIIEKETSRYREKPVVAAVFLNRLKKGIPLQADPTVVYALTNGKENLGRSLVRLDLKIESPFNTYLYKGLPPTPISNPSLVSLKAAAHPADVPYLYFVADGSGGHAFSTTLVDHQKHHTHWRKIRQKK